MVPRALPGAAGSCRGLVPPPQLQPAIASQDGLGQGGLRLKWAKGQFWSQIDGKVKVLRMSLPIVESLSGLQESTFSLFRGFQLKSRKKSQKCSNFIKLPQLPLFAQVGPMAVWGPLGCCYYLVCLRSRMLTFLIPLCQLNI